MQMRLRIMKRSQNILLSKKNWTGNLRSWTRDLNRKRYILLSSLTEDFNLAIQFLFHFTLLLLMHGNIQEYQSVKHLQHFLICCLYGGRTIRGWIQLFQQIFVNHLFRCLCYHANAKSLFSDHIGFIFLFTCSFIFFIFLTAFYLFKAEMRHFTSSDTSVLKQHYEKKVNELEQEKKVLQVSPLLKIIVLFCDQCHPMIIIN